MDLKLCSGIKVSIQENGNSKFLLFDRPIKAMELSQEESTQLGSSLMKGSRLGVTAELRNLISSGFFVDPKTFANIKSELFQKGVQVKTTSLNTVLTKMVEKGELLKQGQRGSYLYGKEPSDRKKEVTTNA